MSWASRRQFIIISAIAAVAIVIVFATAFAIFYKTPSCTDGKMNGEETGVDCGGACTYICNVDVEEPLVRFARPISPQPGRYDIIAYVDNRNAREAVKDARYTIELYDEERTLLATRAGRTDLPPAETVAVYVPEAYRGEKIVAQVFMSFDEDTLKWYELGKKHVLPIVTNVEMLATESPRIRATLENPIAFPIYDIRPVATVFDGEGNAIAASQTILPQLGSQAEAQVQFSWTVPFTGIPARVEVLPHVPVSLP